MEKKQAAGSQTEQSAQESTKATQDASGETSSQDTRAVVPSGEANDGFKHRLSIIDQPVDDMPRRKGNGRKGKQNKQPNAQLRASLKAQKQGKNQPMRRKGRLGNKNKQGRGGQLVPLDRDAAREAGLSPLASKLDLPPIQVLPPAPPARRKRRHYGIFLSFLVAVILPLVVSAWYLYTHAADQYASNMGFSVRKEEGSNASELVGGVIDFGTGTTSDTDILYEYIQSQGLVETIDDRLDLRKIYSGPENDPIFSIAKDASIEDLLRYWKRMVTIYYDPTSGLIETRVLAFTPTDAQAISQAILDESSQIINQLSTVARKDSTEYARNELSLAEDRLRDARTALTDFRARTQLVDPNADIQGQMGLLNNLQAQLADSLIELDLLRNNARGGDPRLRQAEQRIDVIEKRITEERKKFGIGETGDGTTAFATLVGEYEILTVDREFAEQTYLAALANFDAAQAEAVRQTRYLAAHARPTLAQEAEYPKRETLLLVMGLFALGAWSVGVLIYYSIRDRR